MGEFGDKFRKAREGKELSFDDVSNVIKIAPRMLRAIEQENFDQLPGGVFNKGFIRSYAKQLGLDPEEAVNEYLENMRKAQLAAQQAWQPPAAEETRAPVAAKDKSSKTAGSNRTPATPAAQTPVEVEDLPNLQLPRAEHIRPAKKEFFGRPSPEIPWRLVAMAIVIIILGTVLWSRRSRHQHPAEGATITTTQSQTATPAPPPAAPPAGSPSSSKPGFVAPNSAAPQTTSTAAPAPTRDDDKNDVTVRNFGKTLPTATDKSSGALTLTVRASENSWISVVADGQPVTEETLIAPAHPTFHASREFTVKVGNAGAVTFLWNGKELPAQGGEGEVKTLVFDSSGMRTVSPSQSAPATQAAPNQ